MIVGRRSAAVEKRAVKSTTLDNGTSAW